MFTSQLAQFTKSILITLYINALLWYPLCGGIQLCNLKSLGNLLPILSGFHITNKANYTIKQGAITIGLLVELEQNTDNTALEDVDLDIKIAYGGLVLIDKTVKLASVTDNTPEEISVGGPQLGFSGFIDLMN